MVYENTGKVPNVMTSTGGHDGAGYSHTWLFALVIIFFALIFWRRDDNRKSDGLGEGLLTAGLLGGGLGGRVHSNHCTDEKIWDVERDMMTQFANVRDEMKDTAWRLSAEDAKAHSDHRYEMAIGFKNSEILGLQSKGEIIGRIDGLERRFDQDIIRKQGEELNYLKTVMCLQPKPVMPAYPVHPPAPYPFDGACRPIAC
ncbi:MAG: hypothetical protein FWC66_05075 [Oscillospiraceae bacterium]|nr:hypothetical protein [Oscillospiraceae bacterium]